ncbi:MAG TPA: hemerythrin family protein [Geobacterales bacterium]|nr:hemerythrin family protein [Geobacterales bacterium]
MNNSTEGQETHSQCSPSIVDEHRLLTEKIDAASHEIESFFAASSSQTRLDVKRIIILLEDIRDIAQTHFQHEETFMIKNDFPGAIYHKRDHDYLLKSLIHFTSSLNHGTVPFSPDIGVNLRSWLTYHIKKYDDAYVAFIEASDLKGHD